MYLRTSNGSACCLNSKRLSLFTDEGGIYKVGMTDNRVDSTTV